MFPPGRPVSPHHSSQLAVRSPLAWFPREVFQRVVWIDQLSERQREMGGRRKGNYVQVGGWKEVAPLRCLRSGEQFLVDSTVPKADFANMLRQQSNTRKELHVPLKTRC